VQSSRYNKFINLQDDVDGDEDDVAAVAAVEARVHTHPTAPNPA
jgi:hypothetical protein